MAVSRRRSRRLAAVVRHVLLHHLVVLVALLGLCQLSGAFTTAVPTGQDTGQASTTKTDRIVARLGCSRTGLQGRIPSTAVVRLTDPAGRPIVRVTSFDRGWAAFTGEKPGTLVAVCP
jgi:hypothetical protein